MVHDQCQKFVFGLPQLTPNTLILKFHKTHGNVALVPSMLVLFGDYIGLPASPYVMLLTLSPKALRNPHMGQPPLSLSCCHGASLGINCVPRRNRCQCRPPPRFSSNQGKKRKNSIKLICSLICRIFDYQTFYGGWEYNNYGQSLQNDKNIWVEATI